MTRRRRVAVAIVTLTVLVSGVAIAGLILKLKGTGSGTGYNTTVAWATAASTSDDGTALDPLTFGMSPTRASYHVGASALTLASGTLNLAITNAYQNYRTTSHGVAASHTQDFRVQSVSVGGPDAALVTAKMASAAFCGKTIGPAAVDREIDIGFEIGAIAAGQNISFTFDVQLASAGEYVAAELPGVDIVIVHPLNLPPTPPGCEVCGGGEGTIYWQTELEQWVCYAHFLVEDTEEVTPA